MLILNIQKNPCLNQATPINTAKIFLPKKKSQNRTFQPPKNPSCHLKSGVLPPGTESLYVLLGFTPSEFHNPIIPESVLRSVRASDFNK